MRAIAGHEQGEQNPSKDQSSMKSILVVDDHEPIRRLIRQVLEQIGYQVREGCSGKEGVDLYRSAPTDLVIMDILMPEQNGFESIQILRGEFPTVKIIAMTGGCEDMGAMSILELARMLGARRTLSKPLDLTALLDAVREELHDL